MATFMFTLSPKLKRALDEHAAKLNKSNAEVAREAVAAYIGYDLNSEELPKRGRKQHYSTAAEKKEARKARQAARKDEDKTLLQALRKGLKQSDLDYLMQTITDAK